MQINKHFKQIMKNHIVTSALESQLLYQNDYLCLNGAGFFFCFFKSLKALPKFKLPNNEIQLRVIVTTNEAKPTDSKEKIFEK